MANRGEQVLVRTFGGYPRLRKLWEIDGPVCVVAEDAAFERLKRGDASGAVGIPSEDVFELRPELRPRLDPSAPFLEWDTLRPVNAS